MTAHTALKLSFSDISPMTAHTSLKLSFSDITLMTVHAALKMSFSDITQLYDDYSSSIKAVTISYKSTLKMYFDVEINLTKIHRSIVEKECFKLKIDTKLSVHYKPLLHCNARE